MEKDSGRLRGVHNESKQGHEMGLALRRTLEFFRSMLRGKDYVVFASTAMRLNGEKYEDEAEEMFAGNKTRLRKRQINLIAIREVSGLSVGKK